MRVPFFNRLLSFFLVLASLAMTGCCYQFGHGEFFEKYQTVSIPYAEADKRGELTAEVIKKISHSGGLQYVNQGGDLILKIRRIQGCEENLDFRYDRRKTGRLKRSLIPTQTRAHASAEVCLVDALTGKTVRGPLCVNVSVEFDHTYYATWNEVNVFSLGQLNDIDAARDAVMRPLNQALAERIVDDLLNGW